MSEQLLGYLFDDKPHILAAPMSQWIASSPRFKTFATTYRDKIRKKIRVTQREAGLKDLEVELKSAYWLLQEQRFALVYEPYSSDKQRGPDFAVTFKAVTFNVEVTRIGSREMEQTLLAPEKKITTSSPGAQQAGGRLRDTVCDKLGQMRPGMINVCDGAAKGTSRAQGGQPVRPLWFCQYRRLFQVLPALERSAGVRGWRARGVGPFKLVG
jgi:hypothetical protein